MSELSYLVKILGCELQTSASSKGTQKLYVRYNVDGSIRWIWPSNLTKPLFLKTYNAIGVKAKVLVSIIQIAFAFRFQRLLANKVATVTYADNTLFQSGEWALFAGTVGVDQTALLVEGNHFVKIPIGPQAMGSVTNEFDTLKAASHKNFKSIILPSFDKKGDNLVLQDIKNGGQQMNEFTTLHWKAVVEMTMAGATSMRVGDTAFWAEITEGLQQLSKHSHKHIPLTFIQRLKHLQEDIDPQKFIWVASAHNDFTPWNIFVNKDSIAVIDWERSADQMPLFTDFFHFMYQDGIMLRHINADTVKQRIDLALHNPQAQELNRSFKCNVDLHHKLYILYISTHYLLKFVQQEVWHRQAHDCVATWHAASVELSNNKTTLAFNVRQLLIDDIFHFLSDKDYAVMKWKYNQEEIISEYADIDLVIPKTHSIKLCHFLNRHPELKKLEISRKRHMTTISCSLTDGRVLFIDCIHEFKRTNMVFFNADLVIKNAVVDQGVKKASLCHDFYYVWMFYFLNNAHIPTHYSQYFLDQYHHNHDVFSTVMEALSLSEGEVLHTLTNQQKRYKDSREAVQQMPENKRVSYIKNTFYYVFDIVKTMFFHRGFVVSFSGIDGAGKSTVIEHVVHALVKKYRREVVVLRHRPSLLPILSVIKTGGDRLKAEQLTLQQLPRQGSNGSFLSSLVRFSYYYLDYVIGQFLVNFWHTSRGKIVVYDRYYFDFIHDAKRSNISLPKFIPTIASLAVVYPQFNFFLYAPAEEILKRKQELDQETIERLTKDYLSFFKSRKHNSTSRFIAIKNLDLAITLAKIDKQLKVALI